MSRHIIRNSDGWLIGYVSYRTMRRLTNEHRGRYTTINKDAVYKFDEDFAFGNSDINIVFYSGTYIELEGV